ncbi:hypothetical protein [Nonomuraea africana]|uniref:Uncharacterized protein n=1 Tax=Nonomuraea africana TaxID=46171 RepID=A0ABR9KE71_9ACTN|nr:hypothetical protein [Nonomuraea africana]MBE1560115.1 hypothetical protein [Nonomuraea africana]
MHGATARDLTRAEFEELITESDRPVPAWTSTFDTQLGHAILRHCASVLGLDPHPHPDVYLARRAEPRRGFRTCSLPNAWRAICASISIEAR